VRSHPERHYRRSIRLKGYDYRQAGAYFVTIVTQDLECLFGQVVEGQMRVNPFGEIVVWAWNDLPNHNPHVELDAFVVMPNHVHGIVLIVDDLVGAGSKPAPTIPHNCNRNCPPYESAPTIPHNCNRNCPPYESAPTILQLQQEWSPIRPAPTIPTEADGGRARGGLRGGH
jgi:hypothetical protein